MARRPTMQRSIISAIVAGLLVLAIHLGATQYLPLSIAELTDHADLVIQGTVASKTCLRDEAGRIYTRVELTVMEIWKGSLTTNRCIIALASGILGDEGVAASGEATYEVGEEVVAFLVLNHRSEGVTIGLIQGKFAVTVEPGTGAKLARNIFHGGHSGFEAQQQIQPGLVPARLTVNDLKTQVQGRATK